VYRATREAVERARAGQGPAVVEAFVPRITSHSSQDDDSYRTDAERASAEARDPLPRLRETLLEYGLLERDEEERLTRELRVQVLAEADRAVAQPEPAASRAKQWLFAGDAPHPELAELEAEALGPGPFDNLPEETGDRRQETGGVASIGHPSVPRTANGKADEQTPPLPRAGEGVGGWGASRR
jgi:hypothetical protein